MAGFTVMTAADGRTAVQIFGTHANEIKAVLLDMTMPHMSYQTPLIGRGSDHSNSLFASRTLRPDRIGDGNLPDPTPDHWYDITAFQATPVGSGRFGNAGVGILRGPGIMTAAAGLFKSFWITGKLRMRVEATFTNILNHPNFYPPPTSVDSPVSFGKTTSVQSQENSGNRVGQVGARLDW